jgi:hypothetical protein
MIGGVQKKILLTQDEVIKNYTSTFNTNEK